MIFQLMDIRFTFFCRAAYTNKSGLSPIVLRIQYRGERKDVFTGMYCVVSKWDNITQRVMSKDHYSTGINKHLDEIHHRCKEAFQRLQYSGAPFTLDQLIDSIKGDSERPDTILGYLQEKVTELKERVGIDITRATLQKYQRCINHMSTFLQKKYKNRDIAVASIDSDLLMEFFYYLRTEKNNAHNTSVNYIKCLKTVLMQAIKTRVINHDPFFGLKIAPKVVVRGYLTMDEINIIAKLDKLRPALEQVRDIFLFACYTGMAYIDIKQLKSKNIIKDTDGTICIHKARQKTGQLSIIPLLPPAQKILMEYSATGYIEDFNWKVISNQKMNEHLKEIGNLAGLSQHLFFHLARHTFATTITLSNGVPIETVSRMLGHSDIKMTQHYAKISGYKIKKDMEQLMGLF